MPPPFKAKLPPPPEKPTQTGIRGWLARRKWPEIEAAWQREVEFTKKKYDFYNSRQKHLIYLENLEQKIESLDLRISNVESSMEFKTAAENIESAEEIVLSNLASYQLKRDYFGDMDADTLKREFRELVRHKEYAGWLTQSRHPAIMDLVGDGTGFPALPPPLRREDPRIAAARWTNDLLELHRFRAKIPYGRFADIVKYRRAHLKWGTPFTPEFQDHCFEHRFDGSPPRTIIWWNDLEITRYAPTPYNKKGFEREAYDPDYVELYGLDVCKYRPVGG